MGGIKSFLPSIYASTHTSPYDVIVMNETWLNESIFDEELFGSDWFVYRKDRQSTSDTREGGGVLIAVKSFLASSQIVQHIDTLEQLYVKISLSNSKSLYINVAYIPPNSAPDVYALYAQCLNETLTNADDRDEIIVMGDFNLPNVVWLDDDDNPGVFDPSNVTSEVEATLIDGCSDLGLAQICNVENNFGNVLDLVFTTVTDGFSLNLASHRLKNDSIFHKALELNFSFEFADEENTSDHFYYDFENADYTSIDAFLSSCDWNMLLCDVDVETGASILLQSLQSSIDQFVPLKKRKIYGSRPWLSSDLRTLRNQKNRAYRTYISTLNDRDFQRFITLSEEFRTKNLSAYDSYVFRTGEHLKKDPKKFWHMINSKRKSSTLPKRLYLDGRSGTSDAIKCDLFAEFFQSVYVPPVSCDARSIVSRPDLFDPLCLHFQLDEVYDGLLKLDPNKSAGPDDIPNKFLIKSAASIAKPLLLLFNASLESGVFPTSWKHSFIVPIFKSGDRTDTRNYRGIAKLSAIPKFFEKLVCDRIAPLLQCVIHEEQHGFVVGKSTETNMVSFISSLLTLMEQGHQVDAVYTDFQKAFDRVDISLLLSELKSYGLPLKLSTWLSSYLADRTQAVKIGNEISVTVNACSGVPQGSHLGPLLFVLFVNSICDVFDECHFLLYADDLKIYRVVDNPSDSARLQQNLDALSGWCEDMRMSLSIPKCKVISFSRRRSPQEFQYTIDGRLLERVQVMKDLGILMDCRVDFRPHIDQLISRANRVLGFVKRSAKQFMDPYVTKSLFCALVRPILEYGSVGWNPFNATHKNRIESIQKRFLIFALRNLGWADPYQLPSYESRLRLLGMNSLVERREVADFAFIVKLIEGSLNVPQLSALLMNNPNPYDTRHREPFLIPTHHTNYGTNEPMTRMLHTYERHKAFSVTSTTWKIKKKSLLTHLTMN